MAEQGVVALNGVLDLKETAGFELGIMDHHVEFATADLQLEDSRLFVLVALVEVHGRHLKS